MNASLMQNIKRYSKIKYKVNISDLCMVKSNEDDENTDTLIDFEKNILFTQTTVISGNFTNIIDVLSGKTDK